MVILDDKCYWYLYTSINSPGIIYLREGQYEQLILPLKDNREIWQSRKISLKSLKTANRRGEGYNRYRKWYNKDRNTWDVYK